ncbi:hypothetical protein, partial [Halorubrum sp. ASP1]|uniref:hypothetical protein n=1 Tax=Halorubrum sp. ASP1 TaxID=2518114 RepID=UPI00130514B3
DLATDGGEEVPPAENVLFDAIEEHYDDDQCGAPTDEVVRSMLAEQFIDVAEVGRVLQDCYFDGEIYQPSDTTIARTNPEVGHGDE